MKYLPWVFAAAFLVLIGLATNDAMTERRRVDAAIYSLDTLKARHAEREIAWGKQNDSLRGVIATAKSFAPSVVVRHDTALVPVTQWRYVIDTLIPECMRCAARSDSGIAQNRTERAAADTVIRLLKPSWKDRIGLTVGYGITKVGSEAKVGPQVGVSVRIWP